MKSKYLYIIILVLIGVIVFIELTKPTPTDLTEYIKIDGEEYILLSSKRDTIWITKDSIIPEYVPVPGATIEVEVPADVDTTAILKNYFAKNVYNDTIKLDSVGYVSIKDTISQNSIFSRVAYFEYHIPTVYEKIIVKDKPKNQVYLGFGAATDASVYAGGLFKTKKDRIYGLNLGLASQNNTITPYVGGSIYWKLKFKK